MLNADEEKALYKAIIDCKESLPALVESRDYAIIISHFASLNQAVETFFEKILVMDENPMIRANRIALVKCYSDTIGAYYKLDEITNA